MMTYLFSSMSTRSFFSSFMTAMITYDIRINTCRVEAINMWRQILLKYSGVVYFIKHNEMKLDVTLMLFSPILSKKIIAYYWACAIM